MVQLHEQYRPNSWDQVVGQSNAIRTVNTLRQRGLAGRAFWIAGKSGTGKTTIGRLLAAEVADDWTTVEIDACDFTPKAVLEWERRMKCKAIGEKAGHALIVNEAHGLRKDSIRQLLVTLERIPPHVIWVFTTTTEGQSLFEDHIDAHPLLSRCVEMPLTKKGLAKAFAQRCFEIAEKEGLSGKDINYFEALANECDFNMRAMLQRIESGEMMEHKPTLQEIFG
jgi:DNA polymerase-3 subunit gamma/tau